VNEQELEARIASFPRWHYEFDLRGHRTPLAPEKVEKHRMRDEHFMQPMIEHFGGSLAGKRVLDLGCNAGFWSLRAIEAGCDFVLGIDGRQMHIDQAQFVFEVKEIDRDRYSFVRANIFDYDYAAAGPFDIVLCFGLLYHVNKPVSLFEAISQANTDLLLIDTRISMAPGSLFELRRDDVERVKDAVDYALVMVPTAQAVIDVAEQFGYSAKMLGAASGDAEGKYLRGNRAAFVCAKVSDLEHSSFTFQDVASLYEGQERELHAWQKNRLSKTGKKQARDQERAAKKQALEEGHRRKDEDRERKRRDREEKARQSAAKAQGNGSQRS
jgi:SAM-dependent methyltransferase